jgi:hypothetical protein
MSVERNKSKSLVRDKNNRSVSQKRNASINQSSASALVNVSVDGQSQHIKPKRIKLEKVKGKLHKNNTTANEVRKISKSPQRPAS